MIFSNFPIIGNNILIRLRKSKHFKKSLFMGRHLYNQYLNSLVVPFQFVHFILNWTNFIRQELHSLHDSFHSFSSFWKPKIYSCFEKTDWDEGNFPWVYFSAVDRENGFLKNILATTKRNIFKICVKEKRDAGSVHLKYIVNED